MIGLELLINNKGIKNNDLAKKLEVVPQVINDWKTGRRKIPNKYLPLLSDLFNLPEEFFQNKPTDEMIVNYYKKLIENEIGKEIQIIIR